MVRAHKSVQVSPLAISAKSGLISINIIMYYIIIIWFRIICCSILWWIFTFLLTCLWRRLSALSSSLSVFAEGRQLSISATIMLSTLAMCWILLGPNSSSMRCHRITCWDSLRVVAGKLFEFLCLSSFVHFILLPFSPEETVVNGVSMWERLFHISQ